ncbi:MAG: nucleoside-diphosphate sugar epimerase [Gammaproteobacteria bacterium]|nr:nucleoside-diphosphate sugar epimerase [Gammaproteobacteria bacterium]
MSSDHKKEFVVWWFQDGKPGHENQVQGLLSAIAKQRILKIIPLKINTSFKLYLQWFLRRLDFATTLPRPDLIIGAGHATHIPMLLSHNLYGGKIVVLMKPSLPLSWFDLCFIPEHDRPDNRQNVIKTRGVLNKIQQQDRQSDRCGLILVGGTSVHYQWSDEVIIEQIKALVNGFSSVNWVLATSRRTPSDFLHKLGEAVSSNTLKLCPVEDTDTNWLPEQMATAGNIWVTEDSVSMVYEALSSGARVGLLELENNKFDRISRSMQGLVENGCLTRFSQWRNTGDMVASVAAFNEAERCATEVINRCLKQD